MSLSSLAEEPLNVRYSFSGSGADKTLTVVLTNTSNNMLSIRNDDGTGQGSLLLFVFVNSSWNEIDHFERNFNAPFETKRIVQIAPRNSMTFKYRFGDMLDSKGATAVKIDCFIRYFVLGKAQKPYKNLTTISIN